MTRLLLILIGWLNPNKDRHLADQLHKLAETYETRPGEWAKDRAEGLPE